MGIGPDSCSVSALASSIANLSAFGIDTGPLEKMIWLGRADSPSLSSVTLTGLNSWDDSLNE